MKKGRQTEIFFFCLTVIILFLLLLSPSIAFIDGDRNQHQQIAMALQEGREEQEEDDNQALETFQREFCGVDAKPNSNEYITEYVLPQTCEMPLGIAIDEEDDNDVDDNDNDETNKVWYVSTKKGLLGSYNIEEDKFDKEHLIPNWKVRESPRGFSQVWEIEVDSRREEEGGGGGDVWFTDEQQNAIWRYIKSSKTFEMYIIPGKSEDFGTTYPLSIEFDPNNKNIIYFVGTYSPSLWIADISEMKNGTSDGISQIPIPIEEGFRGIDSVYITTGSIAFDNKRDAIWISVLSYAAQKGQIFKYDLDKKSFDIYDLPEEEQGLSSPWGLVVDDIHNDGDLWITNPGTSLFYKIDPDDDNNNNNIVKFVTSKTSPRIFGDINTINNNNNISNIYKNSYTQPSWIKKSNDGSIWFNEQQGNKIARFDPSNMKLIEYWVPTQNRLWGVCSNDDNNNSDSSNNIIISSNSSKQTCGIANVLQFSIGQDHDGEDYQIWFTEWSENKIGKLEVDDEDDDDKNLPFSVTVFESDKELTTERGEGEKIQVRVKAAESPSSSSSSLDNIRMIASGTFTSTGDLGNSTGYFTEQSISMDAGEEREVLFTFIPSADLKPGDYVLMIGAENDSISYLRAIRLRIT
jgi:virginiamycin B lyase